MQTKQTDEYQLADDCIKGALQHITLCRAQLSAVKLLVNTSVLDPVKVHDLVSKIMKR